MLELLKGFRQLYVQTFSHEDVGLFMTIYSTLVEAPKCKQENKPN